MDVSNCFGNCQNVQGAGFRLFSPHCLSLKDRNIKISRVSREGYLRDLILISGGLFLLDKCDHQIRERLEAEEGYRSAQVRPFAAVIIEIAVLAFR